ncbi:hypothetical protein [Prochlorococcus marinus]|uniref:hypothetical protein n=1 Tax=Prochlorococcus marinus TaxID=1219 RepID=UPI00187CE562|nr:hypothetical protein [Prochlorococcus marinus]
MNKFSNTNELSKFGSTLGIKIVLFISELNRIIPIAMITNKFNLSFKKQSLLLEKDKTKENSKNNADITNAVGKRNTPIRKEYLPIFR